MKQRDSRKANKKRWNEDPDTRGARTSNLVPLDVARKRKRRSLARFFRRMFIPLLLVVTIFVFASGAYLYIGMGFTSFWEGAGLALQGGEFPLPIALQGYLEAEEMSGAFALLGEKDMAVVSNAGRESYRIQHDYVAPGLTGGRSRLVVYSRNGNEYTIASRSKVVSQKTTEEKIVFAEMSQNNWLAVCTTGRTQPKLEIYSPVDFGVPTWTWMPSGVVPVMATFASDNNSIAVGCFEASGGELNSRIYLLNTRKTVETNAQSQINATGVLPLQIHFMSGGRVLVVYDKYAALYNMAGEEQSRYEYGSMTLQSASMRLGRLALVVGGEDSARLVLLNAQLAPMSTLDIDGADTLKVMLSTQRVYVQAGHKVSEYSLELKELGGTVVEGKINGLVFGGRPLLFTAEGLQSLQNMPKIEKEVPASSQVT